MFLGHADACSHTCSCTLTQTAGKRLTLQWRITAFPLNSFSSAVMEEEQTSKICGHNLKPWKKKSLFEMFRFYLLSTITFRFYTFIQQQWLRSTNLVFCVHSKRSAPLMNRAIKRSLGASVRGQFDMLKFHYNIGRVSCFWPTQIKKCEKETEKKVNCQLGWFIIHKQIESNLGCNQP